MCCCQHYQSTVEEGLYCLPCGVSFPSGGRVTQLWFDIVCECICARNRERNRGIHVRVRAHCMFAFLCMSIYVCPVCVQAFLGDYMIQSQDRHTLTWSVWALT